MRQDQNKLPSDKQQPDIELEYDEYFDDEPKRKPKDGKKVRKFRQGLDR